MKRKKQTGNECGISNDFFLYDGVGKFPSDRFDPHAMISPQWEGEMNFLCVDPWGSSLQYIQRVRTSLHIYIPLCALYELDRCPLPCSILFGLKLERLSWKGFLVIVIQCLFKTRKRAPRINNYVRWIQRSPAYLYNLYNFIKDCKRGQFRNRLV